jgi:hypothetical protein
MTTAGWQSDQLACFDGAEELEIAVRRPDGSSRAWVPIWVVTTGGQVFVRTWYRRDTGWFGGVVESHRARVRVPGLEVDVEVEDLGEGTAEQRAAVDRAYRDKYGRYGAATVERMTGDPAAAATLRFVPLTEETT